MPYQYLKNCVSCQGRDVDRLNAMLEEERQISRKTFMQHCGRSAREIFTQLGYAPHPSQGLTAAGDYHISYHRSKWNGKRCYFFKWSAIEHIFSQA